MENDEKKIVFKDKEHERFFKVYYENCRYQDAYHAALVYCLGISPDTRTHAEEIYDFQNGNVKPECLYEGWQTSGSQRIIRMAYNLYCNGTPSVFELETVEEQLDECRRYTAEDLFCCGYAPYFWQAVKVRYPEYCSMT